MDVFSIINKAREAGASDVHLVVSSSPVFRINGSMQPEAAIPLLNSDDINMAFQQLTTEEKIAEFRNRMELDFGYTMPDGGRLRCNAAKQKGTVSLVIRILPQEIPVLDNLGLPEICNELIMKPRGLVVVSGPTGSGKSTTLAAMINHLNSIENRRVITIEDPVEYVYTNDKSLITQRELGSDTISFAEALKHVMRQDPDVILVGEMRDLETASAALTVAETGHLVLTTGHAPSAYQTIERIIDLFPAHERHLAQSRLASLLIGVLCQTLIPTVDCNGRIAAIEIMLANTAVRNLIRDGKIFQLPNIIRTNTQSGMQLLDHALADLYRQKLISQESLFSYCNDRDEIENIAGGSNRPVLNQYSSLSS